MLSSSLLSSYFPDGPWSSNYKGFENLMRNGDPLSLTLTVALSVAFVCWFVSVLSGNSSQVDRIWSIVPAVYSWIYALRSNGANSSVINSRSLIMAFLSTMWGTRLTYNFWRKGGYQWQDEDYRWPQLRKAIPYWAYHVFNIVFIALYQNILLWLIATPAYIACISSTPLNMIDAVCTALFVLLLIIETKADQEQWEFQSVKHLMKAFRTSRLPAIQERLRQLDEWNKDYQRGFITNGLFRYSRHPNFFCEQSLWWVFYGFSIAANPNMVVNWTICGTILLTLLFQGSTWYTEKLTIEKYPSYVEYQKSTSRLIPWFSDDASFHDKKTE